MTMYNTRERNAPDTNKETNMHNLLYIHLRLFVYIRVSVGVGWFPFPAFPVHKGVSRVGMCVCVRESVLSARSLSFSLSLR